MLIDVAAASDIGRKKDKNEDSFGLIDENTPGLRLFRQGMLLAVADGLGGHIGGDIASKLAVSIMKDAAKEPPPREEDIDSEREDEYYIGVIQGAMRRANDSIYKTNLDLIKGKRPMGTTLCVALLRPKCAYVGNVGDSRVCLFRDGRLAAQTEDHSWLDEQVKQGLMTQAEAAKDKRKNLLTRSIGTHPEIEIDIYTWRLEPGDQILLCSDGLLNMVSEQRILEVMTHPALAEEKVETLIRLANEEGGKDNITAAVAAINPDKGQLGRLKRRAWLRKREEALRRQGHTLLFGALCFLLGYLLAVARSL